MAKYRVTSTVDEIVRVTYEWVVDTDDPETMEKLDEYARDYADDVAQIEAMVDDSSAVNETDTNEFAREYIEDCMDSRVVSVWPLEGNN